MIKFRYAQDRGHANHGWLDTSYTFSFAHYHDPAHMGFRDLRVINEDRIAPGSGFPMHSHRDMEIITYIIEGTLQHKDSLGSTGVIRRNEVQRMTAGTGISHSEFNASDTEPVHLLQIWILPDETGQPPGYESLSLGERRPGEWQAVVSGQGREGALATRKDVELLVADLRPGDNIRYVLKPARHAWVQVVQGQISLNSYSMRAGDGVAISDEKDIEILAGEISEVLLFDLA